MIYTTRRQYSDLELIKHLEQLEAAKFQLQSNNILGARIALFLLDSLADIITYHFISHFPYDLQIDEQRMDKIKKFLDDRLKFLKDELGYLDEERYQFIIEMRRLRGEAYHKAKLRTDEVVICLVNIYYQIISNLLKNIWADLNLTEQYNLIINLQGENANHLEEQKLLNYIKSKGLLADFLINDYISYEQLLQQVIDKYELKENNAFYINFNKILSNDLLNRIDIVNEMMMYAINSLKFNKRIEQELEKLINNEPSNQINNIPINEKDINDFLKYIKTKDKDIKEDISKKQLDKWKNQANNLLHEQKTHNTLKKWGEIDRSVSKIEVYLSIYH
ncbi:hypothetical protein PN456_03780 [Nodularia spumigena CS-586/05]|uniref:hypothetical protein n=1 Tax=Nodularia spumigena TaxID=70799 RepID=UPI0023300E92|nr:hypothetical protein [Nodularia spumigena]MDB9344155.1 hypothetical protein [Nodularia spumigena CS-588/06]MDB9368082.1 hypothetical protein [Nodularia spumigena CS-586/05]